jgi:hypothetical protein
VIRCLDEFHERQARDVGDVLPGVDLNDPAGWVFPDLHDEDSPDRDELA